MLPDWQLVIRLLVAAALGSVIGAERERLVWAAGLRTHMLVCVGSCLVMIVSAYGFTDVIGKDVILDPSRVAAQVVSGHRLPRRRLDPAARRGGARPDHRREPMDGGRDRLGGRRRALY
jgi:MgtC family